MDDLDILLVVVCLVVIAGLRDIIGRDEEEVDVFTVVVVVVVVVVIVVVIVVVVVVSVEVSILVVEIVVYLEYSIVVVLVGVGETVVKVEYNKDRAVKVALWLPNVEICSAEQLELSTDDSDISVDILTISVCCETSWDISLSSSISEMNWEHVIIDLDLLASIAAKTSSILSITRLSAVTICDFFSSSPKVVPIKSTIYQWALTQEIVFIIHI